MRAITQLAAIVLLVWNCALAATINPPEAKSRIDSQPTTYQIRSVFDLPNLKFNEGRNGSAEKIEQGYVPTDDGTRLFYQKVGRGRQVVIIPGGLFLFDDFRKLASADRTLIFYDMRGRGRSDPIPDERKQAIVNIFDDVKDVERIRQHFKVNKFTLIGYSYLGLMTVMYAIDHPERVERIVQMGPVPLKFGTEYPPEFTNKDKLSDIGANADQLAKVRKLRDARYYESNPKDYCEQEWQVTRFGLVGNPANVEKLGRGWCDMPNEWPVNLQKHFQYSFASVQKLNIPRERVAQLRIPVLTIHGTKDRNASYGSGREWVSILPNARLLTILGAAHQSWVEAPDIIFPAIEIFLQGGWPEKAEELTKQSSQTIFVFHTEEFWLNLHHFLYVLGRAEDKTRDSGRDAVVNAPRDQEQALATLTQEEQSIWREAVSFYARDLSKKDAIFDEPLPTITSEVAQAGDKSSLAGVSIDPVTRSALERAAPVYRKAWWPRHHAANIEWKRTVQALVDKHGAAILAFITRAYGMKWAPEGFHVHLSGYTNWAGAYSTTGELLVVSSLADDGKGIYGLETVFHEGMHQWDRQVFEALREQARKQNTLVPNGLSHAMIFFTAGEAVRQVFPNHVPSAEKYGVWQRGLIRFKAPLQEVWKPYLDGRGTLDDTFAELVKRTAGSQ